MTFWQNCEIANFVVILHAQNVWQHVDSACSNIVDKPGIL